MSTLLALSVVAAAQGVSTSAPPVTVHRDVILTYPGGPNRHPDYTVVRPGGFVPSYWAHPGFTIVRPDAYGFRQPFGGARWIRYHGDALLVDRSGRVHDGRYGYDWSRHRDRWGQDQRGIPILVGNGHFYPHNRDYAWAERFERGGGGQLAYDRDYPYDFRYRGEGAQHDCGPDCGGDRMVETTVTMPMSYEEVTTYEDMEGGSPAVRVSRSRALRR